MAGNSLLLVDQKMQPRKKESFWILSLLAEDIFLSISLILGYGGWIDWTPLALLATVG